MQRLVILFLCIMSIDALAQDERFYRKMFTGKSSESIEEFHYKVHVQSPRYMLDLNRDGVEEAFQTVKKDGVDFIRIMDPFGRVVFEKSLMTKGKLSRVYKAQLRNVTHDTDVLVLHFYDGDTQSATYEGSARLYFLTIPARDLKRITLTKGPYFFTERERAAGKYWKKRYSVNILDYNNDGKNEISVSYNKLSRVYFYISDGVWQAL